MRKILIITTIGGFVPQFEMNDVKLLLNQEYEIHYASNFDNPVYDLDRKLLEKMGIILHPICIHKSPTHIIQNCKALRQICRIIHSQDIDAIHCHNPLGGVLARLAALLCGKKKLYVIYTAHGFHFYKGASLLNWLFFFPVEYLLAKLTDCLVTINREDYLRAKSFSTLKGKELFQIPGVGVDISKYSDVPESKEAIRTELCIRSDAFYVLSVGELNHNKNHEVIIRAIAEMTDKNVYYGICGSGYHEQYLRDLTRELNIEDRVFFFGFRKDIPKMLKAADVFAFPSLREGLGIAAIEAMAAGLPVIASDCRGTREYMKEKVTGCICYSGTVEEYKEIIEWMIKHPDERREMSQASRMNAEKFGIKQTERIMRSVYSKIPADERG